MSRLEPKPSSLPEDGQRNSLRTVDSMIRDTTSAQRQGGITRHTDVIFLVEQRTTYVPSTTFSAP